MASGLQSLWTPLTAMEKKRMLQARALTTTSPTILDLIQRGDLVWSSAHGITGVVVIGTDHSPDIVFAHVGNGVRRYDRDGDVFRRKHFDSDTESVVDDILTVLRDE